MDDGRRAIAGHAAPASRVDGARLARRRSPARRLDGPLDAPRLLLRAPGHARGPPARGPGDGPRGPPDPPPHLRREGRALPRVAEPRGRPRAAAGRSRGPPRDARPSLVPDERGRADLDPRALLAGPAPRRALPRRRFPGSPRLGRSLHGGAPGIGPRAASPGGHRGRRAGRRRRRRRWRVAGPGPGRGLPRRRGEGQGRFPRRATLADACRAAAHKRRRKVPRLRLQPGSRAGPQSRSPDWSRSSELDVEHARAPVDGPGEPRSHGAALPRLAERQSPAHRPSPRPPRRLHRDAPHRPVAPSAEARVAAPRGA